jgi:hypothetical protein
MARAIDRARSAAERDLAGLEVTVAADRRCVLPGCSMQLMLLLCAVHSLVWLRSGEGATPSLHCPLTYRAHAQLQREFEAVATAVMGLSSTVRHEVGEDSASSSSPQCSTSSPSVDSLLSELSAIGNIVQMLRAKVPHTLSRTYLLWHSRKRRRGAGGGVTYAVPTRLSLCIPSLHRVEA